MTMLISSSEHILRRHVFNEIGQCAHNVDTIVRSIANTIVRVCDCAKKHTHKSSL